MNDEVRKEIERLRRETNQALKSRYLDLFGEESRSSNHAHLFRRIAWRLQALSEGDLSERARDRAATLAVDVDLRMYAPRKFWRELSEPRGAVRDPRLPAVGTTLERPYHGQTISVMVLADGFQYDGKIYESLSSIASSVTGTRWNGFTFFGLNKRGAV
jgi:hypothetical protein